MRWWTIEGYGSISPSRWQRFGIGITSSIAGAIEAEWIGLSAWEGEEAGARLEAEEVADGDVVAEVPTGNTKCHLITMDMDKERSLSLTALAEGNTLKTPMALDAAAMIL